MRYLWVLVLSLASTCCGTLRPPAPVGSAAGLVREISGETIALVAEVDGEYNAYCTGVWVDATHILTVAHCAKALMSEGERVQDALITYIVQDEVTGESTKPKRFHLVGIVKIDESHDIALLSAIDMPPHHSWAHLAGRVPDPGEELHLVGQDHGFYWTYMHGYMSTVWADMPATGKEGPFMQITAPVAGGMSGSGAFDVTGALVGLCSMKVNAPDMALYVHLDTIRAFLAR